jgi:hypothetical protein
LGGRFFASRRSKSAAKSRSLPRHSLSGKGLSLGSSKAFIRSSRLSHNPHRAA